MGETGKGGPGTIPGIPENNDPIADDPALLDLHGMGYGQPRPLNNQGLPFNDPYLSLNQQRGLPDTGDYGPMIGVDPTTGLLPGGEAAPAPPFLTIMPTVTGPTTLPPRTPSQTIQDATRDFEIRGVRRDIEQSINQQAAAIMRNLYTEFYGSFVNYRGSYPRLRTVWTRIGIEDRRGAPNRWRRMMTEDVDRRFEFLRVTNAFQSAVEVGQVRENPRVHPEAYRRAREMWLQRFGNLSHIRRRYGTLQRFLIIAPNPGNYKPKPWEGSTAQANRDKPWNPYRDER